MAMRMPSNYGDFQPPHLRHEMAVHVCRDTIWYAEARKDPLAHLPHFAKYIGMEHRRAFSSQMTPEKPKGLKVRTATFLKAAEATHLKWNGSTWTQASMPARASRIYTYKHARTRAHTCRCLFP
eukprot:1246752-Pleurochrysis_carterae.AAC.1